MKDFHKIYHQFSFLIDVEADIKMLNLCENSWELQKLQIWWKFFTLRYMKNFHKIYHLVDVEADITIVEIKVGKWIINVSVTEQFIIYFV